MNAGELFEIKRVLRDNLDTFAESMRSMFKAVLQENGFAIWKCPWCHSENIRKNAGGDRCFVCGAIVHTEFTGYGNEIRVKHSQNPKLDCVGPAPGGTGKISTPTQKV